AKRDWGFAPEYVEMMWLMLQQNIPADYVVGTGQSHTVREFVEQAFSYTGLEIKWIDSGPNEKGIVKHCNDHWLPFFKPNDIIVQVDPRYFRPAEVEHLHADISKAREELCWQPRVTLTSLSKSWSIMTFNSPT
ncbi:MAG: GDP-mannose 4,6-dehydratase, partial [bacterium]